MSRAKNRSRKLPPSHLSRYWHRFHISRNKHPPHSLHSPISPHLTSLCSTSPLYWSSPAIMKNRGTSPLKLTSQLVKVSFEVFNWGFDWELLHSAELGLSVIVISLNLFTSFFILFFTIIFLILCLYFSESYDSIGNWGFTVTRVSTAFHFNWGFDLLGFKVKSAVILCFSL